MAAAVSAWLPQSSPFSASTSGHGAGGPCLCFGNRSPPWASTTRRSRCFLGRVGDVVPVPSQHGARVRKAIFQSITRAVQHFVTNTREVLDAEVSTLRWAERAVRCFR